MDFTQFQKPQRYIGNEWNVVKKSHQDKIRICIAYPDLYEIGMSNLGIRILYGLFNDYPDIVCERVFMPAEDMAQFLKDKNQGLFSLETKTPLDQFEIIGFNFNYELNFTNFLHMLNLGKIPQWANEREKIIVIGGGVNNPEPLADFVDVFLLGEFEAVSDKFVEILRKHKDKQSRLQALSEIEGFYVPSFYSISFDGNKYQFEKKYPQAQLPVKRVFVKNLDESYYPVKWLTPYCEIVHDRVPIEIARGCPNRCTFCQARTIYFPYRQRSISTIRKLAETIYSNSGYESFSFLSLSASDYSSIELLIDETFEYFKKRNIGISLPSLRVGDIIGKLYKKLALLKKTSLTVAIESASTELRNRLNKKIDLNELIETAKLIRTLNIKHIKLYFMLGFPAETEEDLRAIGEFLGTLNKQSFLNLHVSINNFIPKPFSSWENMPMEEEAVIQEKKQIILQSIPRRKSIRISFPDFKKTILEGIISRADRKFSAIIYKAFLKGSRFDGHQEKFSWNIWEEAMQEEKFDYRFYLNASTANFPWSHIETAEKTICKQQNTR